MSIDIYSPRTMIEALREAKPVRTFLMDKFFPNKRTFKTENVDQDHQERGRRVASYVSRWAPAKVVDRLGFETKSVTPPCVANKIPITVQDVSTRVMGENAYENRDPAARGMLLLADDLATLEEMRTRRLELMVRDAIFNVQGNASVIVAVGEDTKLTFTFPRKAVMIKGTLTGSSAWTHADSDPLNQIDIWCEEYAEATGKVVTDIVFGATAYRDFTSNAKVKAKLVNTSLIQFTEGPVIGGVVPDGASFKGKLAGGPRLWTYYEWYDDPDNGGASTEMVPTKQVMLTSDQLDNEMRFGAVQDLTSTGPDGMPTLVEAVALPRSWVVVDPPARWIELRSRPIPNPRLNHFMTVQVRA